MSNKSPMQRKKALLNTHIRQLHKTRLLLAAMIRQLEIGAGSDGDGDAMTAMLGRETAVSALHKLSRCLVKVIEKEWECNLTLEQLEAEGVPAESRVVAQEDRQIIEQFLTRISLGDECDDG